jgi:hypothetical protein
VPVPEKQNAQTRSPPPSENHQDTKNTKAGLIRVYLEDQIARARFLSHLNNH